MSVYTYRVQHSLARQFETSKKGGFYPPFLLKNQIYLAISTIHSISDPVPDLCGSAHLVDGNGSSYL